jgi:uncharacterized protein YegP (UPF0339 family)
VYFDIYKTQSSSAQKYWWVAKGNNHEPLCHSEMLSSKQSCIVAIRVVKAGASDATVYDETGERSGSVSDRRIAV